MSAPDRPRLIAAIDRGMAVGRARAGRLLPGRASTGRASSDQASSDRASTGRASVGRTSADRRIAGRRIAVIGGAHGIGERTVRELAARGAAVVVGDRDLEGARTLADQVPGVVAAIGVDVTGPSSVEEFLDQAEENGGPLDALITCAGIMWVGSFAEEPEHSVRRQIEVNLIGTITVARAVLARFTARGSGHLLCLASAASRLAPPGEATYAATKHGILGYLMTVREEIRGRGVDISLIMPTVVDTALAAGTSSGGVAMLTPQQVAASIVRTLERPRFEVLVPGFVDPLRRVVDLLPRRLRDEVLRRMVPDQVALADAAARSDYERRALG